MDLRQMVFSVPDGGQATLAFPGTVTLEAIETLEEVFALMFRSLRREARKGAARDAGAIEFDSWRDRAATDAARDTGSIEYASWSGRA